MVNGPYTMAEDYSTKQLDLSSGGYSRNQGPSVLDDWMSRIFAHDRRPRHYFPAFDNALDHVWISFRKIAYSLIGVGFKDQESAFSRLPVCAAKLKNSLVNGLSRVL